MEKLLVTGSSGFVGSHLRRAADVLPFVDDQGEIDIRDAARVRRFVAAAKPDAVVHLAALTFVPGSLQAERETYEVNFLGTLNLLEALRDSGFTGRFLYVSSADAYGHVPESALPTGEGQPLNPRNPYAASKAAAEALCAAWSCTAGFTIIRARPFNHIGPGQDERFVISDFAKQLVEIKLGRRAPRLHAGDLDSTRDFTDVRDVIRAYLLLLAHGKSADVYNVCSGKERSVRAALESLIRISGAPAEVVRDPGRDRPFQQRRSVGSNEKLHRVAGWEPAVPFEQSLADVLHDWEEKLDG